MIILLHSCNMMIGGHGYSRILRWGLGLGKLSLLGVGDSVTQSTFSNSACLWPHPDHLFLEGLTGRGRDFVVCDLVSVFPSDPRVQAVLGLRFRI